MTTDYEAVAATLHDHIREILTVHDPSHAGACACGYVEGGNDRLFHRRADNIDHVADVVRREIWASPEGSK